MAPVLPKLQLLPKLRCCGYDVRALNPYCSSGPSGCPSGQWQGCPVQPDTCGVHALKARIVDVSSRLGVAKSLRLLFLELVCMGQDADMRHCGMRSSSFAFGDFLHVKWWHSTPLVLSRQILETQRVS